MRPRRVPGMLACAVVPLLASTRAAAEPPDRFTFQAGRVEADPALGDLTLQRGVELRYDRYRLRSEHLHLRVSKGAVVFDGDARLAFCPCAAPPVTLSASGGRLEPPGDLFLRFPRLQVGKVPVLWLPFLWLRAPDQPGILPPLVAVRGADGLLLGSGVHLPWRGADGVVRALDVSAGGYVRGGAEVGASLVTPETTTHALGDWIHGTRVALDARGALEAPRGAAVAWDLDAVRGDRARSGTIELAAAAQPFDTGAAEASVRTSAGPVSVLTAGGVSARAERGDGAIAAGPRASLALGGAIARLGSWSADAAAVVLGDAGPNGALPLARAAASAEIDARPGPFELRASAAARARYAGDFLADAGPSSEAAAATRVELSLPFARTFAAAPGEAPLVHWINPTLAVSGALAAQHGAFFAPIDGHIPLASWIAAAGVSTSLGRYGGSALRLDARAGATGDASATLRPLLHARLAAGSPVASVTLEGAAVGARLGASPTLPEDARGYALVARARFGPDDRPSIRVDVATQAGAGAGQARAVAAGAWAALPGDALAYLATSGLTAGGELSIPWVRAFRTAARADVDLASGTLLAVRGLAEYRHPCGCLGLGLLAAHRVGRDGTDVAVTVDLVPPAHAHPGGSPPPAR